MKRGETFLPEGFRLDESTREWMAEKQPTVDVEETFSLFVDKAAARAWCYRDWQAAFRNYVRNGKLYGGVVYKSGREHDPRWQPILHEARKHGFREPHELESVGAYRTQFELWKAKPRESGVIPIAEAARRLRAQGNG